MAYLDDVYVVCAPPPVRAVTQIVEEELFRHAHISVHHGKTQVWNRGGAEPSGIVELTRAAQSVHLTAVVWKSDPRLPLNERGLRVLGCPTGSPGVWRRGCLPSRKNSCRCFTKSLSSPIFGGMGCCSTAEPPGPISGCATFNLTKEDHTPIATEEELNIYRSNWWIRSNFVGSDTMPIRHRPDFKEALSTLRRLKNAEGQAYYQNWWQSSSSFWWQWQDSWWHPSSETSPRRWT